ncbi:MAG TPA: hypothetical protein VGW35_23745 [Methylomirabilota bacterium]|jgi:hypothetical protein|nr:hypothetical protein [Methylomirabilota bacterium]
MGGPWRDRGYDPRSWRPPSPRVEAAAPFDGSHSTRDHLTAVVIGYIASVLTSIVIMLTFLRNGW